MKKLTSAPTLVTIHHYKNLLAAEGISAVIRNEQIAKSALEDVLEEAAIPYVDALPALRQSIGQRLYYPGPADMHPGPNGYRVIGETVATFVREAGLVARPEPGRLESRKAASQ